jgi:hypothetical protein
MTCERQPSVKASKFCDSLFQGLRLVWVFADESDFVRSTPVCPLNLSLNLSVKPENAQEARERVKKIVKVESLEVAVDEQVLKPGPIKASLAAKEGGSVNVG